MEDEDFEMENADFDMTTTGSSEGTGDFATGLEDLYQISIEGSEGQGDADSYGEFNLECNPRAFGHSSTEDSNQDLEDCGEDLELDFEEDGAYTPISQLLANDGYERDQWYESPDDKEFRNLFACLNSHKKLAKKYMLEILNPCDDEYFPFSDDEVDSLALKEVNYALNEISIPRLARMSVEKLAEILIKFPSLDLRKYLEEYDVFTVAYVIWGIDFYMNRKCFNITDDDGKSYDEKCFDEKKTQLADGIAATWKNSYDWLFSTISSFMSNVI